MTKLSRNTGRRSPNPRATDAQEPRRVASRLEGVVKNTGIKPKKKSQRD